MLLFKKKKTKNNLCCRVALFKMNGDYDSEFILNRRNLDLFNIQTEEDRQKYIDLVIGNRALYSIIIPKKR